MNTHIIINNIYHPPAPDYDPLNLPKTLATSRFSYDETLPAAQELADRLLGAAYESELQRIVWEAFRDLFIVDEVSGDRYSEEYRDAVYDAWRDCIR